MSAPPRYDVIVVGGGPAGASCAALLAEHGLRVLLLERAKFPRGKICGECMNPRIWPLLETLGIAKDVRECIRPPIGAMVIRNSDGTELRISIPCEKNEPFFAIRRSTFDELLLRRAEKAGATVMDSTGVTDVRWGETWNVTARTRGDGEDRVFTCEDLVGADGRNSRVARLVAHAQRACGRGSVRQPDHPDRVGVQWHTCRQRSVGLDLEMLLFDTGYCGIVNVDDEVANIAMVVDSNIAKVAFSNLSHFLEKTVWMNSAARRRFQDIGPLDGVRTTSPITPRGIGDRLPHLRFIGDAQRTVEPFTGQGVYFAVRDGICAAWGILKGRNITPGFVRPAAASRFWVNRLFSPVLRDTRLAQQMVGLALRHHYVVPLISHRVF